jgi:hypothetical protein
MHVFSHFLNETGGFFCQTPFSLGLYFRDRKKLGLALSLSQAKLIPTVENVNYKIHSVRVEGNISTIKKSNFQTDTFTVHGDIKVESL